MTDAAIHAAPVEAYGRLTEPATLTIQRMLPGPIERVWSYLTESDLRRLWLASGAMKLEKGAAFTFTWRNDQLGTSAGSRPEGMAAEHSMEATITEVAPPHRLAFTWGSTGGVEITLEPKGAKTLLTLVHRRLPERGMMLAVSAGWHAHLDVLLAIISGAPAEPFWDQWTRLRGEYDARLPK